MGELEFESFQHSGRDGSQLASGALRFRPRNEESTRSVSNVCNRCRWLRDCRRVYSLCGSSGRGKCRRPSRRRLQRAADRVRPTLPKRVDDATTLMDVSNTGTVLTYRYMVDSDNYELIPNFMQVARQRAIGLACNTEDTKAAMEAGGTYEFNYSDGKFQSLGGFVVTSADCR